MKYVKVFLKYLNIPVQVNENCFVKTLIGFNGIFPNHE